MNIFFKLYIFNACFCDILYSTVYIVTLKCACSVICFCYKLVILQRSVEVKSELSMFSGYIYSTKNKSSMLMPMFMGGV